MLFRYGNAGLITFGERPPHATLAGWMEEDELTTFYRSHWSRSEFSTKPLSVLALTEISLLGSCRGGHGHGNFLHR